MRQLSILALVATVALAACGDNGNNDRPDGRTRPDSRLGGIDGPPGIDANDIDAPPGTPDAMTADAPPAVADHLLITEVRTNGADEFIEIYNPTGATVNLSTYYLGDVNDYWRLPDAAAGPTVGGSDFVARFPDGATLAAGAVITVAMTGDGYLAGFAASATYAVEDFGAGVTSIPMADVLGPANPTLTNAGEMIVLFRWDGAADLVQDVDLVLAGNAPSAGNAPIAKAPLAGADGGTATTAYAADALTIQDMESDIDTTANAAASYKRVSLETSETSTGGNGITGHDETSEPARTTWDSRSSGTMYTAATPGVIPAF
jgi:hypothetical protein